MRGASTLSEILRPVRCILLDFDGPVCSVFAGIPAREVTQRMVEQLGREIPEAWATENDPLALLRRIDSDRADLTMAADDALTLLETEAVKQAAPTSGAAEFLRACADTEREVWVVSNNAGPAIQNYLAAHSLEKYVAGVFGRVHGTPSSMKPAPTLLNAAMKATSADHSECVFIGDAVRDVQAAHAANVKAVGYANKPGKDRTLAQAGALVVAATMREISDALA